MQILIDFLLYCKKQYEFKFTLLRLIQRDKLSLTLLINYNEDRQFMEEKVVDKEVKVTRTKLEEDEEKGDLRSGITIETISTF